jgi:16S rRNA (adenine1518-N6/adenine1519-N6)-dimethyltransferase
LTVEIDPHLYALASETLIDLPNVTMLQVDALKNKNRLHPVLLAMLDEIRACYAPGALKLVANLPYNIATPLISNLLDLSDPPESMTVTIQKELAERITARPRTKDYSALSLWIQSQCDVEIKRIMAPTVFWPRPKVESAIIQITYNRELRSRIGDLDYWHAFLRAMFFHRRKFLRSELLSAFKGRLGKPELDAILAEMSFAPETRAEELDVAAMLRLCDRMRSQFPDWKLPG